MPRVCEITGKKTAVGNNVSHAVNRTKRKFFINLHKVSFYSDVLNTKIQLRVSSRGRRTVNYKGGIDQFLLKTPNKKLSKDLQKLKNRVSSKTQNTSKIQVSSDTPVVASTTEA